MKESPPPDGTRTLRADASRNREEIVRAAQAEFAENGIDVPLERIASRAGVSRMTLSRHFSDRQALAFAIFEADVRRLRERAAEWLDRPEACLLFLEHLTTNCARNPGLSEALVGSSAGLEKLAALRQHVIAIALPLLRRSRDHGVIRGDFVDDDLPLVIDMLSGALGAERPEERTERGARALRLLLEGLSADRGGKRGG